MTLSSKIEGETFFPFNEHAPNDPINGIINTLLPQFEKKIRFFVIFHLLFYLLAIIELSVVALFFTSLAKSAFLAIALAGLFLSFFSYFILKVYYETKKPEYYIEIKNRFVTAYKNVIHYQEGRSDHHIGLANACCKLADTLDGKEYTIYKAPSYLQSLQPFLEKFGCKWHWEDIHKMKELLLSMAVEENIKLVKCEPTSLDVHASLANAYVMLSGLYIDYRKLEGYDEERFVPKERFSEDIKNKFRTIAARAIEEFQVLKHFAPNDTWVHFQLAYSYHDLQMPEKEIEEYETILKLNPGDRDTLYKLGTLYFEQGLNAEGLKIYEQLKRTHYKKADHLISYYGSFNKKANI